MSEDKTKDVPVETARRQQRGRSIAIGLGLFLLVALFYAATIIHMGGSVANRPM
ncbi:MAG: hypothetical protein ACRBCJ_03190 [Hyphomicrobiaceae bacterium]